MYSAKIHQLLLLLFLVFLFVISSNYKESFADCGSYTNCKTCATASGCSWCPLKKICLKSKSIKGTDECNLMNTINSPYACSSESSYINDKIYTDRIPDKPRPPNVYTSPEMMYSNETVMGELHHMKNEVRDFRHDLPRIVTNTMQHNMRPLLLGALLHPYGRF